jgi:hypothetical protein
MIGMANSLKDLVFLGNLRSVSRYMPAKRSSKVGESYNHIPFLDFLIFLVLSISDRYPPFSSYQIEICMFLTITVGNTKTLKCMLRVGGKERSSQFFWFESAQEDGL